MPGVLRPYSLVDVIGTLNQQSTQAAEMVSGVGSFAEDDETLPVADSATGTAAVPAGWDQGVWGGTQWQ